MHGQLDIKFINGLKERPTFNPLSFAREYQSEWTGTSDNSLVQLDDLLEARVIKKAEHKASGEKDVEYVLAYDVSRAKVIWRVSRKLLISRVGKFGES